MKRFISITAIAALSVSFGITSPAFGLDKSDPDKCGGGNGGDLCPQRDGGPGPSDPSLNTSGMPPGGDAYGQQQAERKEKEADRKQKEAEKRMKAAAKFPVVKSIGKVSTSSPSTPTPNRSICDAARDARARNSPAAPNLEAQCRASKP